MRDKSPISDIIALEERDSEEQAGSALMTDWSILLG